MAVTNSSVLAYNYAVSGAGRSELAKAKTTCMSPVESAAQTKIVAIKAQQPSTQNSQAAAGRKAALPSLAAVAFTAVSSNSAANAGVIDDYLEKSKANKPLPLKNIPGDYVISFVGHVSDRLDYFYNQGRDEGREMVRAMSRKKPSKKIDDRVSVMQFASAGLATLFKQQQPQRY
ncbi:hypothetical protein ACFX12_034322 [Malus domestica]